MCSEELNRVLSWINIGVMHSGETCIYTCRVYAGEGRGVGRVGFQRFFNSALS